MIVNHSHTALRALSLVGLLALGCGADKQACVPGAAVACTCSDGRSANQICNSAGSALGACACGGDASAPTDTSTPPIDTSTPPTDTPAPPTDTPAPMDVAASIDVAAVTDAVDVAAAPDAPAPIDASVPETGADAAPADVVVIDVASTDLGRASDASSGCPAGMALIPAGMFLMGDPSADDMPSQPLHGVRLSAYCIDVTEVTVAAYGACVAPGCTAPNTGGHCNQGMAGRDDHPINCVDWNQSRAYCQWRGADLPTEAQWEYAARGSDGRTFPWGNDAPAAQLCWSGGGTTRTSTCAVRSFASGNSPFGLFDMAGNVWEWTLDWIGPYTGDASSYVMNPTGAPSSISRVNRGGSFGNTLPIDVRPMIRFGGNQTRRLESLGFRCARGAM